MSDQEKNALLLQNFESDMQAISGVAYAEAALNECLKKVSGYFKMIRIQIQHDPSSAYFWTINTPLIAFIARTLLLFKDHHEGSEEV